MKKKTPFVMNPSSNSITAVNTTAMSSHQSRDSSPRLDYWSDEENRLLDEL